MSLESYKLALMPLFEMKYPALILHTPPRKSRWHISPLLTSPTPFVGRLTLPHLLS